MILVTRPEPQATATARALQARGLRALPAPMAAIAPLPFSVPNLDAARALAFSSAYAPPLLAARAPDALALPAYAVGGQTAHAARTAGWAVAGTADTARALAPLLPPGTAHIRGRHMAAALGDLPSCVVYEARLATALPDATVRALQQRTATAALFFSARAARRFVRLARAARLDGALARMAALCLSPRVVDSASAPRWAAVRVPERPVAEALLDLAQEVAR
jgi:uroporphyrinogen-III synthase